MLGVYTLPEVIYAFLRSVHGCYASTDCLFDALFPTQTLVNLKTRLHCLKVREHHVQLSCPKHSTLQIHIVGIQENVHRLSVQAACAFPWSNSALNVAQRGIASGWSCDKRSMWPVNS